MMKVIFLDIDGVLNSAKFESDKADPKNNIDEKSNIDETRLPLLKRLVEVTGAKIVLSSTWRKHWNVDESLRDTVGEELNQIFEKYGLHIMDKTPELESYQRPAEIQLWLDTHKSEIERYVIFDDEPWGWGVLSDYHVRTNFRIGRGLEERHVKAAMELLMESRTGG